MFCDYNSVIHTRSWPQEGLHGKSITDQEQKHVNQHRVTTVVQYEADVDDGQFFVGGEAGSVAVQEQRVGCHQPQRGEQLPASTTGTYATSALSPRPGVHRHACI